MKDILHSLPYRVTMRIKSTIFMTRTCNHRVLEKCMAWRWWWAWWCFLPTPTSIYITLARFPGVTLQWAGVDTEVNNKQLKRMTGSIECGKLLCSWAFVLGQRANGVLASWATLLKLPGEFCFMKFPATWDPIGLVIRSLEGSLLDEKMCLKSAGKSCTRSWGVLPWLPLCFDRSCPTTVYCQFIFISRAKENIFEVNPLN